VLTLVGDPLVAAVGLGIFAVCAALSMVAVSAGFGAALERAVVHRSFGILAPVLGTASFGVPQARPSTFADRLDPLRPVAIRLPIAARWSGSVAWRKPRRTAAASINGTDAVPEEWATNP
jgi:hypothetical protein